MVAVSRSNEDARVTLRLICMEQVLPNSQKLVKAKGTIFQKIFRRLTIKTRQSHREFPGTAPGNIWKPDLPRALIDRRHLQAHGASIMALGADQAIVGQLFKDVSSPAGSSGDGENRGEKVGRQT